jgi:hypothetical protein
MSPDPNRPTDKRGKKHASQTNAYPDYPANIKPQRRFCADAVVFILYKIQRARPSTSDVEAGRFGSWHCQTHAFLPLLSPRPSWESVFVGDATVRKI